MDCEVKSLNVLEIESEDEWFDAPEAETSIQHESKVSVLKEEDIWKRMEDEIQNVSDLTSLSKSEATLVLSHFRWDVKRFYEEWFVDEKGVRESVGILEPSSDDKEVARQTEAKTLSEAEGWETISEYFFCGGCEDSQLLENFASVSCGHLLCTSCWTSHINNIINETPAADWYWKMKCPYNSCPASVDRDMIESYASEEEKSKYNRYLREYYVDNKKTMKWCPAECSCAIDVHPEFGISDVTCSCLFRFCWNCRKDAHSPVDCKSAAIWVLENTVPCPKCNRRIEESQDGSLKLTCLPPCNHKFCWHCRGDWIGHREEMYICNFDAAPYEETDQLRKMAEFDANRYKDCREKWQSNELLMQKAKANLRKLHFVIQDLSNTQLPTEPQLEFILEAGLQVMESRRVLTWTYAYEYYLPENKQDLLKIKQDHVKLLLEELDYCLETELPRFLEAEGPSEDFNAFRVKLTELTSSTRKYNESLVRDLEDGLANVTSP